MQLAESGHGAFDRGGPHVIDYRREDFTASGKQYDRILAVNGFHPVADYYRAQKPDGMVVVAGGSMNQLLQAGLQSRRNKQGGGRKACVVSL
jgi:NADPH:quinone reductase-like Zn-dependent oxidoreductase